jgi:O-antigen ligase
MLLLFFPYLSIFTFLEASDMVELEKRKLWINGLCALLMFCLFYSKYFLSVSMILLLFGAVLFRRKAFIFRLRGPFLWTGGMVGLVIISILYSENFSSWFHHFKMKLPFVVLPLAFFNLPRIDRRNYYNLHYFFSLLVFLVAIPAVIYYFIHFSEMQEAIGRGKSFPLPIPHVQFGYFLAFGICCTIILYRSGHIWKWKWERKGQMVLIVLSVMVLHLLAIRTGIILFYITLAGLSFLLLIKEKKWKPLALVLLLLVFIPTASYFAIPSFKQKVHYMSWDIGKHSLGEGANYSDSERIGSIQVGWEIWRDNPLVGVGFGDIKDQCIERYRAVFGPEKYVLYPHNQYLFIAVAAGIIGLFFFLIVFLFPYYFWRNTLDPLLVTLGIMVGFAFLIDNVLERSVSVGFYAFFLSVGMNYHWKQTKRDIAKSLPQPERRRA